LDASQGEKVNGKAEAVKLGLIVNPIAGIGGRVGLKGSDGRDVQQRALELGAEPRAGERTKEALLQLEPLRDQINLLSAPVEMGEVVARECGFDPLVVGEIESGETTAEDTKRIAAEMLEMDVELILFAGGDGTARDIYQSVDMSIPVLGIPAGVKIHSAVYALNPRSAGDLAAMVVRGQVLDFREAEVMDIDEDAFRAGRVSAQLHGYLKIPAERRLVQVRKVPGPPDEEEALAAIGADVVENRMEREVTYLVGPGTTTRAIARTLGLSKTLLGVDVLREGEWLGMDQTAEQLLNYASERQAKIIVTPIGGQGYLFGRGNQQFSPQVIREVGKDGIIVVSTPGKLQALEGRPFLVDTGDAALDEELEGYMLVITGYRRQTVYRVGTR
jgi:predicted polyphosphate/ATP-dependent NAD kinase